MEIRYSCIYITRKCPRSCAYCSERNAQLGGRELTEKEWRKAITILDSLGVKFHLFLGNEVLLMDNFLNFIEFMNNRPSGGRDYAFYTTFPPQIFEPMKAKLANSGVYNLSAGIDFLEGEDELGIKGRDGTRGLLWAKSVGISDLQATLTLHKKNIDTCEDVVRFFSPRGIWSEINIIHWNLDGGYDFFPRKLEEFAFTDDDKGALDELANRLVAGMLRKEYLIHSPPEYLLGLSTYGINQNWHCEDTKIVTVDASGALRCCGYRPGRRLPEYTVFDLGEKLSLDEYKRLWKEDSSSCPGCMWAYTWFVEEFYKLHGKETSDKILQEHYYGYIDEYTQR